MAAKPKKSASPDDLRKGLKNVNRAMSDMMALRGASDIPSWEKKLNKEQRALERAKAKWAAKEAASKPTAKKAVSPAKAGAASKVKAQGAKAMGAPTSGYGKSTKPKGK